MEQSKKGFKGFMDSFATTFKRKPSSKTEDKGNLEEPKIQEGDVENEDSNKRDSWGNGLEFLMTCIAFSVGLGNVWRFPFTALDNGGGAFIIPYLIILVVVGRPIYYMEMVIGQFSSRNNIKVYDSAPISRGIGVGQLLATGMVTGYYASLLAIIIRYLVASFYPVLPWSYCRPEWGPTCVDSAPRNDPNITHPINATTSAEFFFYREVLKAKDTIHDGVGSPDLQLSLYLLLAWIIIALVVIKGVKSTGKVSYFLALFPYVIMTILFVRAVTLPGAGRGIAYLFTPQWSELYNPRVWYAAASQVFFSLSICFGCIITLSSYNKFSYNIYRDATIISFLDTFTSLYSATTIFGILGNLAYENGSDDIQSVVSGDTGLAFVSYPNAISRFEVVPQLFSVLFFLMLLILGVGSAVGLTTSFSTVIKDRFSHVAYWKIIIPLAVAQFFIGLMYVTPGGQHLLSFVDFFGVSFVVFFLGCSQLITFGWIYGVNRLCLDIKFMLDIKTGWYWRICWAIVTPALMIAIFVFNLATFENVTYQDYAFPDFVYAIGWVIAACAMLQLPLWGIYTVYKREEKTLLEKIKGAVKPSPEWGPQDVELNNKYQELILSQTKKTTFFGKIKNNICG